jgi:hypothetical protein
MLPLILVCIFSPVLIAKSGEVETKLKFEIDNKKSQLWKGNNPGRNGRGPIRPTHVAVFHIQRPHEDMPFSNEGILQVLKTSAGQSLSKQQREFLTASDAITWWGIQDIMNHDTVCLYAVSEEDAKKTVKAYLEVPTNEANARMQEYEEYLKDRKKEIIEIKKVLPEKQKQADQIEPKYTEIKKSRYFSLSDEEAYEKAKETMLEKYRSIKSLDGHDFSKDTLNKLEQMLVEQMIELKSVKAREQAAIKIRDRDKTFVDLFIQWKNVSGEVNSLKANLESSKRRVQEMEESLNNPTPDMLPPEIYQNKVTIYPVLTE